MSFYFHAHSHEFAGTPDSSLVICVESDCVYAMPKVLVANRGESTCHIPTCEAFLTSLIRSLVAIRILRAATELGWSTITIFTENDCSHAGYADESVELGSATDFMDVDLVVTIALKYAVPPSPIAFMDTHSPSP